MAEAAVEERSSPSRYYCHRCSIEFDQLAPGYTCPNCEGGFIEELAPPVETHPEENNEEMDEDPMVYLINHHMGDLASLLFSGDHHHHNNYNSGENDSGSGPGASSRHQGRRASRNRQPLPFENLLQDIIVNLTSGHWGGGTTTMTVGGPGGGGPMMFLGNPGDYAWGREGLDSIVTQLINQMDSTGPPPLESEQISSLPTVKITSEQTSMKLQCSVCWEDFKEQEVVRQLPCSHVYHDSCIFPWLRLHATCPICRKSLNARDESLRHNHLAGILQQITGSNDSRIRITTNPPQPGQNPAATVPNSNPPTDTQTDSMGQSAEEGPRTTRGPIRDYNMDLEFD